MLRVHTKIFWGNWSYSCNTANTASLWSGRNNLILPTLSQSGNSKKIARLCYAMWIIFTSLSGETITTVGWKTSWWHNALLEFSHKSRYLCRSLKIITLKKYPIQEDWISCMVCWKYYLAFVQCFMCRRFAWSFFSKIPLLTISQKTLSVYEKCKSWCHFIVLGLNCSKYMIVNVMSKYSSLFPSWFLCLWPF